MQNFPTKSSGSSFTSSEFNDYINELENMVTGSDQALSAGDSNQLGKASAIYASGGDFFTDGGAANAYSLSPVGSHQAPDSYFDGMRIRFRAANSNTGASTVNVDSIGVVSINQPDGSALLSGSILQNHWVECLYYNSGGYFVLMPNSSNVMSIMPPVGTILMFHDYSGALTFDTAHWAYMDGSTISDAASPMNGYTLEDVSGRYFVGFGTDGGGDIDSAAWATGAVGNALHQVNLAHTHTGPSHTHSGSSHTHYYAEATNSGNGIRFYQNSWQGSDYLQLIPDSVDSGGGSYLFHGAVSGTISSGEYYSTSSGGTGNTGAAGTGATGSSGSATQDIQPRSIRMRAIIRYK